MFIKFGMPRETNALALGNGNVEDLLCMTEHLLLNYIHQ